MSKKFKIIGNENIDINQVEDGYVVYQAAKDRVHYLNPSAVLVFESCTGDNSVGEIVRIIQEAFELSESPEKEVTDCLESLLKEGLIEEA